MHSLVVGKPNQMGNANEYTTVITIIVDIFCAELTTPAKFDFRVVYLHYLKIKTAGICHRLATKHHHICAAISRYTVHEWSIIGQTILALWDELFRDGKRTSLS